MNLDLKLYLITLHACNFFDFFRTDYIFLLYNLSMIFPMNIVKSLIKILDHIRNVFHH